MPYHQPESTRFQSNDCWISTFSVWCGKKGGDGHIRWKQNTSQSSKKYTRWNDFVQSSCNRWIPLCYKILGQPICLQVALEFHWQNLPFLQRCSCCIYIPKKSRVPCSIGPWFFHIWILASQPWLENDGFPFTILYVGHGETNSKSSPCSGIL